jgi:Spx/MgsR family transcriptional regulator
MKKAMAWLDKHDVSYEFHDYKKQGVDLDVLKQAIAEHGWDIVINKKGTTWRNLPEEIKNNMDEQSAVKIAQDNTSIIKRPLLVHNEKTYVGFDDDLYKGIF